MARMTGVPFLGIADNGLMTRHDILTIHTIVGYQSGGNAAHWTTGASGRIVQARDTRYCSAANLNGNWHTLAIENEDTGPAYKWVNGEVPRFTAAQAESIAEILAWCHKVHDIPLSIVPDSKVGRRGIAYHRQGIDGNFAGLDFGGRVVGGELWSSHFGKVCPGDNRIHQLINEIIPRARQLVAPAEEVEEDDMVKFMKGDGKIPRAGGGVNGDVVFKVEYCHDGAAIAVRTRVPNPDEPGYRAHLASGGKVHTVPQAVLDAIPTKIVSV